MPVNGGRRDERSGGSRGTGVIVSRRRRNPPHAPPGSGPRRSVRPCGIAIIEGIYNLPRLCSLSVGRKKIYEWDVDR